MARSSRAMTTEFYASAGDFFTRSFAGTTVAAQC
jgi:hypothetical protein